MLPTRMTNNTPRYFYLTYEVDNNIRLVLFVNNLKNGLEKKIGHIYRKGFIMYMTACSKKGLEGKKTIQVVIMFKQPLRVVDVKRDLFCFGEFCPIEAETLRRGEVGLLSILKHFEKGSQPSPDVLCSNLPPELISMFFGRK